MHDKRRKEQAVMWYDHELGDLEVLRATYVTHTFAWHTHGTFTIGLIEGGAGAFSSRGTVHVAEASNIFIIHPGEVHNGYAAAPGGWTYRVLYPDPSVLQHILAEQISYGRASLFFSHVIVEDDLLRGLLHSLHGLFEQPSGRLERESALNEMQVHLIERHADHAPGFRVQQAKVLLREEVPLTQVALEMGFAEQCHFARRFRHIVGVTSRMGRHRAISPGRSGCHGR